MTTTPTLWKSETIISSGSRLTGMFNGGFAIVGSPSGDLFGQLYDPLGVSFGSNFVQDISDDFIRPINIASVSLTATGVIILGFDETYAIDDTDPIVGQFDPVTGISYWSRVDAATTFEFTHQAIATLGNGSAVVYRTPDNSGNDDVFLAILDSNNDILTQRIAHLASDETQQNASITQLKNGNIIVVWENYVADTNQRYIRMSVFDQNGFTLSLERDVGATSNAAFPSVTALENGNALIVWQDVSDKKLYYKILDTSGEDLTVTRFISDDFGILPKVVSLADGGFVLGWDSYSGQEIDESPDGDVIIQRLDAAGNLVGSQFRIDAAGDQTLSDITVTSDGRIVVVYSSESGDSTESFYDAFVILDPRELTIQGTADDDVITARFDTSTVNTLAGNDILYGVGAKDILIGGDGSDTYIIDATYHQIFEMANEGTDEVQSTSNYVLTENVENLFLLGNLNIYGTGNSLANTLVGNAGANILDGGAGADALDGGAGADVLKGGLGNDTYVVDNVGDTVSELTGQGTDLVQSSISFTLSTNVENLTLTGTAAINATGNSLTNGLVGNDGANRLDGGVGADVMRGGLGNDTYIVDNVGDRVFEFISQGVDLVQSSVSFNLGGQYLENLTLTGTGATTATGNSFANTLVGNAAANTLSGLGGNDVLNGAGGSDLLNGGAGQDTFSFTTGLGAGNVDRIADFLVADDTIRLSKSIFTALGAGTLTEAAFKDLSTGAADTSDRILYNKGTGGLFYDADGSGAASAAIQFATLDNKAALTHLDFFIV